MYGSEFYTISNISSNLSLFPFYWISPISAKTDKFLNYNREHQYFLTQITLQQCIFVAD